VECFGKGGQRRSRASKNARKKKLLGTKHIPNDWRYEWRVLAPAYARKGGIAGGGEESRRSELSRSDTHSKSCLRKSPQSGGTKGLN